MTWHIGLMTSASLVAHVHLSVLWKRLAKEKDSSLSMRISALIAVLAPACVRLVLRYRNNSVSEAGASMWRACSFLLD